MTPQFFVVARVVGSPDAFPKWEKRLDSLCEVSLTEPQGTSYYWAQDLDGEPDTIWGLEGYSHAVGFFLGHPSSKIFQREMALVDKEKLLKNVQGLGSPDYDLHHYDFAGGWLTFKNDADKNSRTSHVAVHHFWAKDGQRDDIIERLVKFSEDVKSEQQTTPALVQSCAVLKECVYKHGNLTTLWLRTKTREDYTNLMSSATWRTLQSDLQVNIEKTEIHQARAFNGHIDQPASFQG